MDKNEIKKIIKSNINNELFEEAEEIILQYKKIFKYDDEIASMDAIISIYKGNYEESIAKIREGLKYNIYSSDLYYTMGNLYEIKKKYENAYLCYEQALKFNKEEENNKIILQNINRLKKEYNIKVNNYSIIILTYNQLEYTKVCINSIKKYNGNENCEIIIVDNNSTDGTVEWLKNQEEIKYILNENNKGFPTGCNQGIEIAEKNNDIFLLNNDTVIMPNSIFNLRMALYFDEKVGATGSISNSVSYYQQINEQYDNFDEYVNFALKNNITNENSYEQRIKLVGFAMMIKRNVLDKVGRLDERFTPGNFEDDDISFRIVTEGYKLLLCKDSYIHHFGSISFKENPNKYNALLKENSKKMYDKWGFFSENSTIIRYDLINLINEEYNKKLNILDIGCGCGATLLAIKNKYPNSNIYGVEENINSVKIAQSFSNVCIKNLESLELNYEKNFFDYILLGDILEKIHNPRNILETIKKYLKDNGNILASVGNIMHFSIIRMLLNGEWKYQNEGILDKNNIRFFTKSEIIKILEETGYQNITVKNINQYYNENDRKFVDKLSKLSVLINSKEEFNSYRYLLKAKNYIEDDERIIIRSTLLIRRIEFGIEENKDELIRYIKKGYIKSRTIINIIMKNIVNKIYILNYLAIECFENNIFDMVIPLLNVAYELDKENLDTNYNLSYMLNIIGENGLALKYLNNLKNTNDSIEELKNNIIGSVINE